MKKDGDIVPCGKCEVCKKRRISSWSFRLMQEDKVATSSYFLTLTYDTDHVPITRNGFMSLSTRDIQLFFKRLRKTHTQKNPDTFIKYYCAGEYGGKTFRPHYHIILFNVELKLMFSKTDLKLLDYSDYDGKQIVQCKQWNLGTCTVGKISDASVGYTMKYIAKPRRIPLHRNDDRRPEYAQMSKGLGISYLTEAMLDWHLADLENRMYVNIPDGKKATMSRYYKDKIYWPGERAVIARAAQEKMQAITEEICINAKPGDWQAKREAVKASFKRMQFNSNLLSKNQI